MQAQRIDPASRIELSSDAQGWTWRVARTGRPPLQGRAPSHGSAGRTGRFAVELVEAFDRISRRSF
jgi:hypothetical protein